jgi:hypothetical protein
VPVSGGNNRVIERPDEPPLHILEVSRVGEIEVPHMAQYSNPRGRARSHAGDDSYLPEPARVMAPGRDRHRSGRGESYGW